jgi:nicotinamidase-related amidase
MLLQRQQAQLLVIDVQEKLAPHVDGAARVIERCGRLIGIARLLGVPATLTEHYPQGLGATVAGLVARAGNETPILDKIEFSALRNGAIKARLGALRAQGREEIVVAGMEAHVCVAQTCLDLIAAGYKVRLIADAVGSREPAAREIALDRLARAGATVVHHEMVAFEWLGRGDDPRFKDVLAIVK